MTLLLEPTVQQTATVAASERRTQQRIRDGSVIHLRCDDPQRGFPRPSPTRGRSVRLSCPTSALATVVDVSTAGVRLWSRRLLPKHQSLNCALNLPGHGDGDVSVRIVWTREQGEGYEYGASLQEPEHMTVLEQYIDFLTKSDILDIV